MYLLLALALVGSTTAIPLLKNTTNVITRNSNYVLPGESVPTFYDVQLILDPDNEEYFTGIVEIRIFTYFETNELVLQAMELTLNDVKVFAENSNVDLFESFTLATDDTHMLRVRLQSAISPLEPHTIRIEYTGLYAENMFGIYLSTYESSQEGPGTRKVITSQLQPTFARRAFPCYDEPDKKAVFRTTIYAPAAYPVVRSNMPLRTDQLKENIAGYLKYEFQDTVLMSSYLIAYLVSNFESVDNTANPLYRLPFAVLSRPGTQSYAEYALDFGQRNLVALEEYTGFPYAFPKMDKVAVPDFAAGAMENWGLVVYREAALLVQDGVTTTSTKESIASIICHENTHMWFGNEVSPQSWTYTWLNEGFANFFQSFATDLVFPGYRMMDQFLLSLQSVMQNDAVLSVNPMTHEVYTPSEIIGTFNSVAYQKSGSVIRMMQHFLTPDVFRQGLANYLRINSRRAVAPADLIAALEDTMVELEYTLPYTLTNIMQYWTTQGGFPVLTVRRTAPQSESFSITQERFLTDRSLTSEDLWHVPINWVLSTNAEFTDTRPQEWLPRSSAVQAVDVPGLSQAEWFLVNKQQTGYYRVNYDSENWEALAQVLSSSPQAIHLLNRAQIIDDSFNLARNGRLNYRYPFEISRYLAMEKDYIPWAAANTAFTYLDNVLSGSAIYGQFQNYLLNLTAPLFEELGFTASPNEEHVTPYHRTIMLNINCRYGNERCVQQAQELLQNYRNGQAINPDIQTTVFCSGLRGGDEDNFNFLWDLYLSSNDSGQQSVLLSSLGCTTNEQLREFLLNQVIDDNSAVREQNRHSIIVSVINSSPENMEAALDFVMDHFDKIQTRVQGLSGTTNILAAFSNRLTTETHEAKINEFYDRYENIFSAGELAGIATIRENLAASIAWSNENYAVVDDWLTDNSDVDNDTSDSKSTTITDTSFANLPVVDLAKSVGEVLVNHEVLAGKLISENTTHTFIEEQVKVVNSSEVGPIITNGIDCNKTNLDSTSRALLRNVRPGQEARQYAVEITFEDNLSSFAGRVVINVQLTTATREDPIIFYCEDLDITSVRAGRLTEATAVDVDYFVDEGLLNIETEPGTSYVVVIEYTGTIRNDGAGIFRGNFRDTEYIGMNLYPTNARRVFPSMDEPSQTATVSFTFNDVPFNALVGNSQLEENSANQFRALQTPVHLWGALAHNMVNILVPSVNVLLYGRTGLNQDVQASVAIQHYITELYEWTDKNYFEIINNQDGNMRIFALPDTDRDWVALSTVIIWEPHIFMETQHSIKQRKTALVKIAEALSRQWFGFVIHPDNWSDQWILDGLVTYVSYEMYKTLQGNPNAADTSMMIDVNTIFVMDVIQESLLKDSYSTTTTLRPVDDLFDEGAIRNHMNGIIKTKAPAFMRMFRLVLGDAENDFIQSAAQLLLSSRALQTVSTELFLEAINSFWSSYDGKLIDELEEFMEPWLLNRGYPVINIGLRQGGILVTQEHFGFGTVSGTQFDIPLTWTTSANMNFDNVYPVLMMSNTLALEMSLDDEEAFVLFNVQGQGYYRVNYDNDLWFRIIEALNDPDTRAQIHPLNRATLIDDALNLARAGKLDYDIAFQVVLAMQHETEYAPWKAFVRNMNFIKKRLLGLIEEDEDLDTNIYMRMVQRTVGSVESALTFSPEPGQNEPLMDSLTRGLVMEHACQVGYDPCIAAAIDLFYDPNDGDRVNPNIPHDIRPAVYCTMVREGDAQVRQALYTRLEEEASLYERLVILEALACSQDNSFIRSYLDETIAENSPYGVEERSRIFTAVAESSYQNAWLALNHLILWTQQIRLMYGGAEKLEQIMYVMADNIVDIGMRNDFSNWVNANNNNLDDSTDLAERLRDQIDEDMIWNNNQLDNVYQWIDENDAPTLYLSFFLIIASFLVTLHNL